MIVVAGEALVDLIARADGSDRRGPGWRSVQRGAGDRPARRPRRLGRRASRPTGSAASSRRGSPRTASPSTSSSAPTCRRRSPSPSWTRRARRRTASTRRDGRARGPAGRLARPARRDARAARRDARVRPRADRDDARRPSSPRFRTTSCSSSTRTAGRRSPATRRRSGPGWPGSLPRADVVKVSTDDLAFLAPARTRSRPLAGSPRSAPGRARDRRRGTRPRRR